MVAFTNPLRDHRNRSLKGHQMKGVVVNNDDSGHEDGVRGQRCQIRCHSVHANVKDADLPWFSPQSLDSANGSGGGSHGPVPPVGTVVHVTFMDDSQYHGQYMAGPVDDQRKLTEFTKKGTRYGDRYPHVAGSTDYSGSLTAHDYKGDAQERTHVAGTSHQIDGKGNVLHVVNGNAPSKNKDAVELFPSGGTLLVHGDGTVWASGKLTLNAVGPLSIVVVGDVAVSTKGNAAVTAGQNATVSAQKDATVVAGQSAKVSAKQDATVTAGQNAHLTAAANVDVTAGSHLQLTGATITSSVEIVIGGTSTVAPTSDAATPKGVSKGKAPTPRRRPNPTAPADTASGEDVGPDAAASTSTSQADAETAALDQTAKDAVNQRALASLTATGQDSVTLTDTLPSGGSYSYTATRDA